MINKIKNKIDRELAHYIKTLDSLYDLGAISDVLLKSIKNFLARKGKRLRPTLFVIGYLGFAKREARNLYTSALSLEFLHDFMLIHDDIIDRSDLRRGLPSMHKMLDERLKGQRNLKFDGSDLAIVVGDVIYAMAIDTFLSIEEDRRRKEKALKKFTQAALYTGSGEFVELLLTLKDIDKITKEDIYKIYDLKTADYTFSSPLSIGALLAGATAAQCDKLFRYGTYLGRAFQIKDDILDMFGDEKTTGKSPLTDLKESKKTLLLWHAWRAAGGGDKAAIRKILASGDPTKKDLVRIRRIVSSAGSLDYAKQEIGRFIREAKRMNASLAMRPQYKKILDSYCDRLLTV
jgi:geranylgeranyl diphosphate synthase type I